MDLENIQILRYIICYQTFACGINLRTQARKELISYYKTYGITSLTKHVDIHHMLITKEFDKRMNNLLKEREEIQP